MHRSSSRIGEAIDSSVSAVINIAEAAAPTHKNKQPAAAGESINLKVKGLEDGEMLIFKTKKGIQLKKLMKTYCEWVSVDINENRFFFGGRQITVDETPDSLGMEDGDEIHALRCQCGAVVPVELKSPPSEPPLNTPHSTDSTKFNNAWVRLSVHHSRSKKKTLYNLRRDAKMRELMEYYCSEKTFDMDYYTVFSIGGRVISPDDTPDTLGMKNEDVILCHR